jgi:hypothetical protein
MSNIQRRGGTLPAVPTETAQALEEASTRAIAAFAGATNGGSVLAALDVAKGIEDLRALFSQPEIQARVVALQDTPLGFRTDRDPKVMNRKTGQPNQPYPYDVVRDAVIEAGLRGLQLVGNQFNIISGRFYGTKEGFEFLIRKLPNVSDFRPVIGVPQTKPGGVLIDCEATWQQNGKPFALKVTIPVKGDDYSSADQYIGKATRKLLKRCYEVMTGNSVPEGDAADDAVTVEATATTVAKPVFRQPAATTTATTEAPAPAPAHVAEAAPDAPIEPPQQRLAALVTGEGITFDQFTTFLEHYKYDTKGAASFDELPTAIAARLAKSEKTVPALKAFIQPA